MESPWLNSWRATLPKRKSTTNASLRGTDGTLFPAYPAVKACLEAPVAEYNGARKIVQSVGFKVSKIPPVDLSEIGYSPSTKLKALDRMYYDPIEADRVKSLLKKREHQAFSAVSMSMIAGNKDKRSMGHCLNSMVISVTQKRLVAEVVYRSTEVIKKHTADLAFLPRVFDRLEIEPDEVRFYFCNAYLSGVFFPTLFLYWEPLSFLEMIRLSEPKLFIVATRFLRRSVQNRGQKFPYSPEHNQHELAWNRYPEKMSSIRDYLSQQGVL